MFALLFGLFQMFTPLVCNPPLGSASAITAPVTGQAYVCTSTWDTTQVSNGPHTLTIRAFDIAGNMAEYSITVIVNNVVPNPPPKAPQNLNISMGE